MISSRVKVIIVVFALFLFTGVVTVGCKQKSENSWVNTDSMPGHAFNRYNRTNNAKRSNSKIIYLGSDRGTTSANFGPRDVNFNFRDLN